MPKTTWTGLLLLTLIPLLFFTGSKDKDPTQQYRKRYKKIMLPGTKPRQKNRPLVIVLHGYGSHGNNHARYFRMSYMVKKYGIIAVAPNGTKNKRGVRFWNASDACCDFFREKVDDVGYLRWLIKTLRKQYKVGKVYLVGHSNGGFMAYRYICEHPGDIAGIISLAGAASRNLRTSCKAIKNVNILQLHGGRDKVVKLQGGKVFGRPPTYPAALHYLKDISALAGCKLQHHTSWSFLVPTHHFSQTKWLRGERHALSSCPKRVNIELWKVPSWGHGPYLSKQLLDKAWKWVR